MAKHNKSGTKFTSCASAHDLRCLDIEKERENVSSPRGVLEACRLGEACLLGSVRDSHKSSSFEEDGLKEEPGIRCSNSRARSNWSRFFKLWKKKPVKRLPSFPPLGVSVMFKKKPSGNADDHHMLTDIYAFQSSLRNFRFSELVTSTDNFRPDNIIGKGGHAEVYQGCLPEGKLIAVKRLTKGTADERTATFLSELGIIAHVNHPNTAKLIGCCIEGGVHLVFQLSPLGSLGSLLHGPSKCKLDWTRRYKIALGTADGLTYLHESCQRRIIHRDIKADNILLTEDFEPQICDFGLAKWLPKQLTHHNVSKFEGTFGYFAPEYFMHGIVDEKTDVYAFGVLLLELITGRQAVDDLQTSLVLWAKPFLENQNVKELIDPSLGENYNKEEIERTVRTATLCIGQTPILRPRMSQVVALLKGGECIRRCGSRNKKRSLRRTYSEEGLDAQDYNLTKYLKDIDRIKEIALAS